MLDRRRFLASTAALGAAAVTASIRPRAFAAGPDGVDDDDLAELRKRLGDRLVAPSDARYDALRRIRNRDFDGVRPRAIVMAASTDDVRFAVQWAADRKVPVVPRAGGHSYVGQSVTDGLVVSVLGMAGVAVDKAAMTATVGAGALNIDANIGLLGAGVALPTGSCPSVGVAGLTLGGGIGFSSRRWGLMCDNLVGATLVLASGEALEVDERRHPEWLWALRGGGHHLGVATSFTFRVHEVEPIAEYELEWPWSAADRVLEAWQRFAPDAPDELFSVCMLARGASEPRVLSYGRHHGSAKALRQLVEPLLAAAPPRSRSFHDSTFWASHVTGPKCAPDPRDAPGPRWPGPAAAAPNACHSWNHPTPGRFEQSSYSVKSDYFTRPFDADARHALIAGVEAMQREAIGWGGVILDPLGGAINRVAADATAYVHRGHRVQAEYVAHWGAATKAAVVERNRACLRDLWQAMRPHASGEHYQNYPDLELADWATAYYGKNLYYLRQAKAMLDPGGVFRGRQLLEPRG